MSWWNRKEGLGLGHDLFKVWEREIGCPRHIGSEVLEKESGRTGLYAGSKVYLFCKGKKESGKHGVN